MYNDELTLIDYEIIKDDIGNSVKTPIESFVLCRTRDIGNNEYYDAKVAGLKPSIKIIIHSIEYENQKECIYRDVKYKITRTYTTEEDSRSLSFDEIELTCEKVKQ